MQLCLKILLQTFDKIKGQRVRNKSTFWRQVSKVCSPVIIRHQCQHSNISFCRILEDRADRFTRRFDTRKKLEADWCQAAECKRARDLEEKLRGLNPGLLLHDTVDQHKRCKQCLRKLINCGESNIWRESRYIPGSRLMV